MSHDKDMRSVQAFNKAMRAFALSHQLGERIMKLESTIQYPPTAGERQEAETLMHSPEFARLTAERNFWNFLTPEET
jgi:hypothetical protein